MNRSDVTAILRVMPFPGSPGMAVSIRAGHGRHGAPVVVPELSNLSKYYHCGKIGMFLTGMCNLYKKVLKIKDDNGSRSK